ncbi:glucosidase family protein [Segatella maculosa]|uniref:hypothetical protein n=1 Tax=Segatella maculosa TaxID=439703 RepID=UPI0003610655|nr:hypothetical protein [Segatella maculosa]
MRKAFTVLLFITCIPLLAESFSMKECLANEKHLTGKPSSSHYLCVTASPHLYSIGCQDGQFRATGWHIEGEMGGVWMHPVKLLDGFSFNINGKELIKANKFITYPYAQQFTYDLGDLVVTRTDFAVDNCAALASELVISNVSGKTVKASLKTIIRSNLMPTWLSDRAGINNGSDTLLSFNQGLLLLRDNNNNWFSGALLSGAGKTTLGHVSQHGLKAHYPLLANLKLKPGNTMIIRLTIGGSLHSAEDVGKIITNTNKNIATLFAAKQNRYQVIDSTAKISIPDQRLQQAYEWGKYCTDWLIRDVPGLGRGMSAGLPDYPWFFSNDQSETFRAIVGTREPSLMKESLYMLLDHSRKYANDNGSVLHEMSTNGQIYAGDRKDEPQDFMHAVWTLYKWTGDHTLLEDMYCQALNTDSFLTAHDTNNNLFPEGYGGVEIEGLNGEMFDVACHTAEFYNDMVAMSRELGYTDAAKSYQTKADTLTAHINQWWWDRENKRYYDILAGTTQALKLIASAKKNFTDPSRNRWAIDYLDNLEKQIKNGKSYNGYSIFFNPSSLALTTDVADTKKGQAYLESVKWFCNKYGLYISGISRPDNLHSEEGSVAERLQGESFNYRQAVMPRSTSQLAIAACKYQNADSALFFINRILNNISYATPGTSYEVSPDYGQFVQAWNVGGINIPIIQYFFGINPMASHKQVVINPNMPSTWSHASIDNVLIGNNSLSMDYHRENNSISYKITTAHPDWTIVFHLPQDMKSLIVNGKAAAASNGTVLLCGKENKLKINK